jgi:hypothetical protein
MTGNLLFNTLFHPSKVFEDLSQENDATMANIPRYSLLILLLPPLFSWLGGSQFGWRVGGSEPVFFDTTGSIVFSFFYFIILCVGFFGTVVISKWMATTYEAKVSPSLHVSIFTVICAPVKQWDMLGECNTINIVWFVMVQKVKATLYLGAPNLRNNIWLYGATKKRYVRVLHRGVLVKCLPIIRALMMLKLEC